MAAPLLNHLGAGIIPPHIEQRLVERGIKFANYAPKADGTGTLLTSVHENVYQRWAGQIESSFEQDHGLPLAYRLPASAPAAPVPQPVS